MCKSFHQAASGDVLWRDFGHPEWEEKAKEVGWKKVYMEWLRDSSDVYVNIGASNTDSSTIMRYSLTKDYDYLLKFLMVGDGGVGKSSFLLRYCDDSWTDTYISTIGVDFKIASTKQFGLSLKLQIWDTAGPERFRTITSAYYRGAHGLLLFCDSSEDTSLSQLEHWFTQIRRHAAENVPLVLVGTKSDLSRPYESFESDVANWAEKHNIEYVLTSAKTGEGVTNAVDMLIQKVIHQYIALPFGLEPLPNYVPSEDELSSMGVHRKPEEPISAEDESSQQRKCVVS